MNEPLISGGYVIIARKIRKSPLWLSLKSTHRMVMMEILLQAQWQDGEVVRNGEILYLKRGQVATSYQQLVSDIGDPDVTAKVVRTAINKMEKSNFLAKDEAVQRAKKGLLLTVVKYDFFQDPDNYKGRAEVTGKGRVRAEQGQSEGRVRAINNNINNVNKEKVLYGDFVKMTPKQYDSLINDFGEVVTKKYISNIDDWFAQDNKRLKKYSDHSRMVRAWKRNDDEKVELRTPAAQQIPVVKTTEEEKKFLQLVRQRQMERNFAGKGGAT